MHLMHSVLSRPRKEALAEDQAFPFTRQMLGGANDGANPFERIATYRQRFWSD